MLVFRSGSPAAVHELGLARRREIAMMVLGVKFSGCDTLEDIRSVVPCRWQAVIHPPIVINMDYFVAYPSCADFSRVRSPRGSTVLPDPDHQLFVVVAVDVVVLLRPRHLRSPTNDESEMTSKRESYVNTSCYRNQGGAGDHRCNDTPLT
jgi:hypothetical protein